MNQLVLASASPQRKTLLEGLGLLFQVDPSSVDESSCAERDPLERSKVLARMKAADIAARHPKATIIGCDTLVVSDTGELLEKPADAGEARRMLLAHSGKRSVVHSAVCVLAPGGKKAEGVSTSSVWFKQLTDAEVEWWIGTGQWKDRSGGFQIDGQGQLMIERIDGDWTGVVGLPVFLLGQLLQKVDQKIFV